jgi:hypothetical protein
MTQIDMLDPVTGQILRDAASKAANLGIERAVQHAERVHTDWAQDAAAALGQAASSFGAGELFTIEQLRALCTDLPAPPDLRAWGGVTRIAMRLGYIERTHSFALATSSNNSPKPLYAKGEGAGT